MLHFGTIRENSEGTVLATGSHAAEAGWMGFGDQFVSSIQKLRQEGYHPSATSNDHCVHVKEKFTYLQVKQRKCWHWWVPPSAVCLLVVCCCWLFVAVGATNVDRSFLKHLTLKMFFRSGLGTLGTLFGLALWLVSLREILSFSVVGFGALQPS